MIDWTLLFTCLLIALARVTDITLDTIRTVFIVQGRRATAALLGFFEALIYIVAVAKVLQHFDHAVYAVAYATGFAAGTYLGITLEQRLALGEQIVAIFTRKVDQVAPALRDKGYAVTEFHGKGRDGDIAALYVQIPRRRAMRVIADARDADDDCFYLVHDIRLARHAPAHTPGVIPSAGKTAV